MARRMASVGASFLCTVLYVYALAAQESGGPALSGTCASGFRGPSLIFVWVETKPDPTHGPIIQAKDLIRGDEAHGLLRQRRRLRAPMEGLGLEVRTFLTSVDHVDTLVLCEPGLVTHRLDLSAWQGVVLFCPGRKTMVFTGVTASDDTLLREAGACAPGEGLPGPSHDAP